MAFTFGKEEKLKSRKQIESLFLEGQNVKSFPFRLIYHPIEFDSKFPIKAGFSVPKRSIKLAVNRNRLKRKMKELYRLNKQQFAERLTQTHAFMFVYMGKEELSYNELEKSFSKLITKFNQKILQDEEN